MTAGTGRNDTYYRNNSYVVWNVSASYSPDAATTMYVKVNNLNDEAYDLYHNYPAAGRNWQVGVKKKFLGGAFTVKKICLLIVAFLPAGSGRMCAAERGYSGRQLIWSLCRRDRR